MLQDADFLITGGTGPREVGRGQASGTAIGAAGVVPSPRTRRTGIWLTEQVVPPGPFFERLAAQGLVPRGEAPLSLLQTQGEIAPS